MSEIASRVKAIIVDKLGVEESEVTNEASFTNDLGADSLDTVELIMEFEKEFGISIPDDQAETIGNCHKICPVCRFLNCHPTLQGVCSIISFHRTLSSITGLFSSVRTPPKSRLLHVAPYFAIRRAMFFV